jgi:hypothetical protein
VKKSEIENGEQFEGWVILELMGHRRLAGYLREQELGGTSFLRLDVFVGKAKKAVASQFYSASAVYCITPTTEAIARQLAESTQPAPVTPWELQTRRALLAGDGDGEYE